MRKKKKKKGKKEGKGKKDKKIDKWKAQNKVSIICKYINNFSAYKLTKCSS